MKKIFFFLFFAITLSGFSQQINDTINSLKLREKRQLTISLPPSFQSEPNRRYPILFLMDGDYLMAPFQGALTYGNYWEDLPELIVVGLTQNDKDERSTDCTLDAVTGLPEGKGEVFYEFIAQELIPYIQQKYKGGEFKIIAGHDITASFLNVFLYKDDPVFDAYISLSPELASGMEEQIPDRLANIKKPLFYYHSTAEGDVKKMREKIFTLDKSITAYKAKTVNYQFDDFKSSSHYGLVLNSIPNALYQIFAVFPPISVSEFNEKIAPLSKGFVDYLEAKYNVIEKTLQLKMPIRLNDFKAIEAAILKNKAYDELEKLSALARKSYPKSMLADYELALMHEKKDDKKNASKFYMLAFQKDPIGQLTKTMMLEKSNGIKSTIVKKDKKVTYVDEGKDKETEDAGTEEGTEGTTEEPKKEETKP
ncbi:MAG: alpha/beta hydrolase-fold protein [Bacteroidota bacterium]